MLRPMEPELELLRTEGEASAVTPHALREMINAPLAISVLRPPRTADKQLEPEAFGNEAVHTVAHACGAASVVHREQLYPIVGPRVGFLASTQVTISGSSSSRSAWIAVICASASAKNSSTGLVPSQER